MKKFLIINILVFISVAGLLFVLFLRQTLVGEIRFFPTRGMINKAAQELNYCDVMEDCVPVNIGGASYPPVYILVNKNNEALMRERARSIITFRGHGERPALRLFPAMDKVSCDNGRCIGPVYATGGTDGYTDVRYN